MNVIEIVWILFFLLFTVTVAFLAPEGYQQYLLRRRLSEMEKRLENTLKDLTQMAKDNLDLRAKIHDAETKYHLRN